MSIQKARLPVKTLRDQYADATRRTLLDAARTVFATHGYEGASLDDVATKAKATKGAVYHHFKDKKALFSAVYEEMAKALTEEVSRHAGTKAAGQLDRAITGFLEASTKPQMLRVMLQDGPAVLGEQCRVIDGRYGLGLLVGLLEKSADPALLESVGSVLLAKVALAMVIEAAQAIGAASDPRAERRRVDRLMRHIFTSLSHPAAPRER